MPVMSMDRSRRDFPVKTHALRRRRFVGVPAWYLRLQLRGIVHEIGRLEEMLAGEFGVIETLPLVDELERLARERDALLKRLARF